jgi:HEAT repeat protein
MSNPTESLISIIRSSDNFSVKHSALQTFETADISTQEKAQGAVASLAAAWYTNTNISAQRTIQGRTRKLALGMISRYGTSDASVYPNIDNSYKRGADDEEKIAALQALSVLASDEAVRLLSSYLYDMNTRLDRGTLTKNDERLVRVIIPALGSTGNKAALASLNTVEQKDWTGAVHKLAQSAIKKLQ